MEEEKILELADAIYANAKDHTHKSLAKKLGVSVSRIAQIIALMRKEGVAIATAGGTAGVYRATIRKWVENRKEK